MLQFNCRHSSSLPPDTCAFCNSSLPESLLDLCVSYINGNLETICSLTGHWRLKGGIALPVEICEKLLNHRSQSRLPINSEFVSIFKDLHNTRLKRVKLRDSDINDSDLRVLLEHRLLELDLNNCPNLSSRCVKDLSAFGAQLVNLTIAESKIFSENVFGAKMRFSEDIYERGAIFDAPNLKKLTIRDLTGLHSDFFALLLQNLANLSYLDLSNCADLAGFEYSEHLSPHLSSLVLYNCPNLEAIIPAICKLANLRHLDISQSKEENGIYHNGNKVLGMIVASLPRLSSLDISGTNLAGRGVAEVGECAMECDERGSDIPGLSRRMGSHFQYLGLYDTSHNACLRHDIPAKLIAGNANEEQILVAAVAFLDRTDMLQKVLNELFHLLRFESCRHVGQALNIVLESMGRHLHERHVQISGSATLFYIVKGTGRELHDIVRVKRRIITALLNGMIAHKNDETMMRNGCLTLCQFKIPSDVLFDYERLVRILLHSVRGIPGENFVQRIGIYLLNSLACQVDGYQKVKLGELGAIEKMVDLISNRLERNYCDDVLEVAWSTMWNVTDETPSNCQKFLQMRGMEYFLLCLKKFPDKDELLRNMMGLLGNVAEVRQLRKFLIAPQYLWVFSDLLNSRSDGIEVSYNAAGVIAHIASDGPEVWTVEQPSRKEVLSEMMIAISRWDLNSQRNINYRSFQPILYLVDVYHTPECQQWAVWALANLTKVYPEKYCALVEKEGGLILLKELINHPFPPESSKDLSAIVIENCRRYKEESSLNEDAELDG